MPVNPGTGLYERPWTFAANFNAGDDIERADLDAVVDDLVAAVNDALTVLTAATTAASQAAAYAAGAASAGAVAGAEAGAVAAEFAAATKVAEAQAFAVEAEAARDEAQEHTTDVLEVKAALLAEPNGMLSRVGPMVVARRTITAGVGVSIINGDGASGNPTISVDAVPASEIAASGTADATTYLRGDFAWAVPTVPSLTTATGLAPSYAARAWVNFNGTGTVAIRASANVSSITDNGAGDYTVNFAEDMPDANYAAIVTSSLVGVDDSATVKTASAFRFNIYNFASVKTDAANVSVVIFR
ncbi:MAG: hypothetical protein IPM06_20095 [Rhizobiales bacterium]|nr:hypothetical protein [Hyphomicrobiales bacterium]